MPHRFIRKAQKSYLLPSKRLDISISYLRGFSSQCAAPDGAANAEKPWRNVEADSKVLGRF